jgi:hypothetical protein
MEPIRFDQSLKELATQWVELHVDPDDMLKCSAHHELMFDPDNGYLPTWHYQHKGEQPMKDLDQSDVEADAQRMNDELGLDESIVRNDKDYAKETFYFTFGVGHKLIACLPESTLPVATEQEGIPLAGKYVRIEAADENEARIEMHRRWGRNWSSVYDENRFEKACAKYNYTELKLS